MQELNGGLIALSACLHGEVAQRLTQRRPPGRPRPRPGSTPRSSRSASTWKSRPTNLPEQHKVNEALFELAPRWGLPLVATNDVHYLKPEDARAQDVLLCIQTGQTVNSARAA